MSIYRYQRRSIGWTKSRQVVVLLFCAAACGSVAACGSSSSSSTTAPAATAAARTSNGPKFSGPPIVISTETADHTAIASWGQIFAAVKAAAAAMNATGGINGHEVVVHTCNTNADPNQEVACARRAVSDGSVATVGNAIFLQNDQVEEVLAAAGIPDIASVAFTPKQLTLSNTFPIINVPTDEAACTAPAFTKEFGITKATGVLIGLAASAQLNSELPKYFKALHNPIPVAPAIGFAQSTSDFTPIVQRISSEGANLLLLNTSIQTTSALASTSISLGKKWNFCGNFGNMSGKIALGLGSEAAKTNLFQGDWFPPPTAAAQYPLVQQFVTQMKAEQAAGDTEADLGPANYLSGSMNAWLGMQVLKQAAESIHGPLTRQSMMTATETLKPDLGNLASIDFSKPLGSGGLKRVFNPWTIAWKWDPTKRNWYLVPGIRVNALSAAS
jgi:branched-chain amino acid transport system substrate-binding protein